MLNEINILKNKLTKINFRIDIHAMSDIILKQISYSSKIRCHYTATP